MKGVVLAGTGSGVGKTSIATGLMARLSGTMDVQAFKAGPDFIDPMFHSAATGRAARNLDSFLMSDGTIRNLVGFASKDADMCVIEGVRGLYEGRNGDDDQGSTAHLAKLLGFPVILVVDARSLTRSAAAIINGFVAFDPDVNIAGVILNNVSGAQHRGKLETALERYCPGVELVGMIPKRREKVMQERYMGLKTEDSGAEKGIEPLRELAEPLDLDRVLDIAESCPSELPAGSPYTQRGSGISVAVPRDDAFCFYYRENLECMEASGAEVRFFSPVGGDMLPDADMYYIGGGYPELYADEIAGNRDFLEGLKTAADDGRAVVGEGGGMLTMCRTFKVGGEDHGMSGILDADAEMTGIRHGPTYVVAEASGDNPLFSGTVRGHEYHYSDVSPSPGPSFGFQLDRGLGMLGGKDGLMSRNCIGTYIHQHALSKEDWFGRAAEHVLGRP